MPLPGGPSDKLGNRYELRWVVRRLLDLVTGRLDSLRIEPPGEDGIDFRCSSRDGRFAFQVKRGISGVGHWTLSALGSVIDDFGELLDAEPALNCVFASAHAAPELLELSERARAARSAREFAKRFLGVKWLAAANADLRARWRASDAEVWRRLQRVSVLAISEEMLLDDTECILQLLFDAAPATTRAVLTDLALDSVHVELRAADVAARLLSHSIRRTAATSAKGVAPATSPPPASGLRREAELRQLTTLATSGKSTLIVTGITGIGKTTVAAQYAELRGGPACWLDCSLIATGAQALATIGEFLAASFDDRGVAELALTAEAQAPAIARLAGRVLASNECLLIWDGLDGERRTALGPVVDAIATTIGAGGTQVVTTQEVRESGRVPTAATVRVDRLDRSAVSQLLSDAFPDALTSEFEAADDATQGHPYLLQLLIDAGNVIDLGTATKSLRSGGRAEYLVSTVMGTLSTADRLLLSSLAWLDIPFGPQHVERLAGDSEALLNLATRHLVVRSAGSSYHVHDLVSHLVKSTTPASRQADFHERAALLLRGISTSSWLEVRATLRHAKAAAMHELTEEVGTALLRYAIDRALWGLAREAAEALVDRCNDHYPHFVLGKCLRMTRDFEGALASYRAAERLAPDAAAREKMKYECASVLCELGRRDEAEVLYGEMLGSDDKGTCALARVALALGMSARGETDAATAILEEARALAVKASDPRLQAEVHHAIAQNLIADEKWEQAQVHAKEAHTLRFSLKGPAAMDVLGWFHLYATALLIERTLGNREAARSAAHGLWRFAILSGSVVWEARAAHALCLADPSLDDPEVNTALARLRAAAAAPESSARIRVALLESLSLCEWSLGHHEESVEAILRMVALSNEQRVEVPVIGHLEHSEAAVESVVRMPFGYGLIMPPGEGQEFVTRLVSRVLTRRPDLARHAQVTVATRRPPPGGAARTRKPKASGGQEGGKKGRRR